MAQGLGYWVELGLGLIQIWAWVTRAEGLGWFLVGSQVGKKVEERVYWAGGQICNNGPQVALQLRLIINPNLK